jgi:uncharacterized repeat protein (TIGR03803 family)
MEGEMKNISRSMSRILAILAATVSLVSAASSGSSKVIYSFAGGPDGEYTDTDLAMDNQGNLYGTSVQGGKYSSGTVFEVTPSGTHTVLYSFTGGADGGEPYKGVTLDAQGDLYGTAVSGGAGACDGGCGVVYKLTNSRENWTWSLVHSFTGGKDGSGPGTRVTIDKNGNLYGTTPTGGAYGLGVVYQMKVDASGHWSEKVIHAFTGGKDGAGGSAGRLLLDAAGNLYGVCTAGGANGQGVVFELTPTPAGNWNFTMLYAFKGQPDAGFPYSGLIRDGAGNLYGTSYYSGANNVGAVYRLRPSSTGQWTETVLYSFQGGAADGSGPIGTLVSDRVGNLYGTTSEGGAANYGTIFKVAGSNGKWTESVVYSFTGSPDGSLVYNGMVSDSTRTNFYGATVHGGTNDDGTIFQFTP